MAAAKAKATTAKQPAITAPAAEWLVYADALQEARDPRGELIVLNHAVESKKTPAKTRDAYVAANAAKLLGIKDVKPASYRIGWKHCLIDSATIIVGPKDDGVALVEALFASPAAADIRCVSLVGDATKQLKKIDLTKATAALATLLPPTCTDVRLVDDRAANTTLLASRDFDPKENLVKFGKLKPFISHKGIERLTIIAADAEQLKIDSIKAPTLKSFVFNTLRFGADAYNNDPSTLEKAFGSASWPKIENLEIRLTEMFTANSIADEDAYDPAYNGGVVGEDDFMGEDDDEDGDGGQGENEGVDWESHLRDLFVNLKKTSLKRLALTSFDSADSLLALVADVGLPATLEELDFSDSTVNDAGWFVKNKALIKPLKRLILERTTMTANDAKKLAKLGPEIKHSVGPGAPYRYVVGSE